MGGFDFDRLFADRAFAFRLCIAEALVLFIPSPAGAPDPHAVERAINEHEGDDKE